MIKLIKKRNIIQKSKKISGGPAGTPLGNWYTMLRMPNVEIHIF